MAKNPNKKPPFIIRLEIENGSTATYRVNKDLFSEIEERIKPFKSEKQLSKMVRCIETNQIFRNAKEANLWLIEQGITDSYHADNAIKMVCKGKKETACGYHWRFMGLLV